MTRGTTTCVPGAKTDKEAPHYNKNKPTQGKQLTEAKHILRQQATKIFYPFLL